MNPIVELAERCQQEFRSNIITKVTGKYGPDHSPTVEVQIQLPNGRVFKGSGANQKIARQHAAEAALKYLDK